MRTLTIVIGLTALAAPAFGQGIEIGPNGLRVHPGYERHYAREDRGRCRELRYACMHKEEMGEEGMGNCQRYREMCR